MLFSTRMVFLAPTCARGERQWRSTMSSLTQAIVRPRHSLRSRSPERPAGCLGHPADHAAGCARCRHQSADGAMSDHHREGPTPTCAGALRRTFARDGLTAICGKRGFPSQRTRFGLGRGVVGNLVHTDRSSLLSRSVGCQALFGYN